MLSNVIKIEISNLNQNEKEKLVKYILNNLSPAEKDGIVDTIFRTVQWMKDDEFPQVWMSSVTDEDKEILKKYQELLKTTNEDDREDKIEEFEKDYEQISDFYNLDYYLDDYLDSEFFLYKNNENFDDDGTKAELKFFKSKEEVIAFGVSEPRINSILFWNYDTLSPNYEINKWIDQHYQKEFLNDNRQEQITPNYEMLDSLLKLEIGRMSDEEVKVYAESRESLFEKYKSISWIPFILKDLGEKSLLKQVANDLVISVSFDYERRDYVELIHAELDRLQKQENGDKKIRKWIDRFSHSLDYNGSEAEWSEINEIIKEKVQNIKLLENKIINLESEKQKPKLLDKLYEEFDEARENLAGIYGINDPDNLSDLVDEINEGAKWILIKKEEKGEHKFSDFAVYDKKVLEKILKENNVNNGEFSVFPAMQQYWIFEVYEPSSNLNLVGKMLVDNAKLLNNYKTNNDIEDFVSFVVCGKISQFEAEQFGIFEKEKEVQKETKTKTLKMKI